MNRRILAALLALLLAAPALAAVSEKVWLTEPSGNFMRLHVRVWGATHEECPPYMYVLIRRVTNTTFSDGTYNTMPRNEHFGWVPINGTDGKILKADPATTTVDSVGIYATYNLGDCLRVTRPTEIKWKYPGTEWHIEEPESLLFSSSDPMPIVSNLSLVSITASAIGGMILNYTATTDISGVKLQPYLTAKGPGLTGNTASYSVTPAQSSTGGTSFNVTLTTTYPSLGDTVTLRLAGLAASGTIGYEKTAPVTAVAPVATLTPNITDLGGVANCDDPDYGAMEFAYRPNLYVSTQLQWREVGGSWPAEYQWSYTTSSSTVSAYLDLGETCAALEGRSFEWRVRMFYRDYTYSDWFVMEPVLFEGL